MYNIILVHIFDFTQKSVCGYSEMAEYKDICTSTFHKDSNQQSNQEVKNVKFSTANISKINY